MGKKAFKKLLLSATTGYFQFNNEIFQQIDGVAMGNPLTPLLADAFMNHLEKEIFAKSESFHPVCYHRYVDDTIAFFKQKDHAIQFLQCLNSKVSSINFTMETQENNSIPFLDLRISINDDGLNFNVYRKPTYTGRLINFKWIVPNSWKIGIVKSSIMRAINLCSDWKKMHEEFDFIKRLMQFNGFPIWIIEKKIYSVLNAFCDKTQEIKLPKQNKIRVCTQYVGLPSDSLQRNLKKLFRKFSIENVSVCFSSVKLQSLFSPKDKTICALQSLVIYKYQCSVDPSNFYIGKTFRHMYKRIGEHKKPSGCPTAVTNHLYACDDCCDSNVDNNFEVYDRAKSPHQLEIMESIYIKTLNPPMNRQLHQSGASFILNVFN